MTIGAVVRREFDQIFRKARNRISFIFLAGMVYAVVLGFLYAPGLVKQIPFAVYDADGSALSRAIGRAFEDSDIIAVRSYAESREELMEMIARHEAYGAIEIPADFSEEVKGHGQGRVLLVLDGSNTMLMGSISPEAQQILIAASNHEMARMLALKTGVSQERVGRVLNPVQMEYRVLSNPTRSYLYFFLIGLALASFQAGMLYASGASIHYEYNHAEETRDTNPYVLLLGKFITYWLCSFAAFTLIMLGAYFWGLTPKAPVYQLYLLSSSFAASVISWGLLASSLFRREASYVRAVTIYAVPAFILAGYMWPLSSMGSAINLISGVFPMKWVADSMRSLYIAGEAYQWEWNACVLWMGCAVCLALAPLAYRRGVTRDFGASLCHCEKSCG